MNHLLKITITFTLFTIFFSCRPEPSPTVEEVYDVLQSSGFVEVQALRNEDITRMMKSSNSLFRMTDLLKLLSEYNQTEPDYRPSWSGFVQGQGCNNTHWDYTGAPCDSVQWILHGDTITNNVELWFYSPVSGCGFYDPPCNGGHEVKVRTYLQGSIYEREAVSWALINYPGKPICDLGIFDLTPSGTFEQGQPIVFEPYEFLVESRFEFDLNNDHKVDIEDLLLLIADFG